jgi:hypothetical protein
MTIPLARLTDGPSIIESADESRPDACRRNRWSPAKIVPTDLLVQRLDPTTNLIPCFAMVFIERCDGERFSLGQPILSRFVRDTTSDS